MKPKKKLNERQKALKKEKRDKKRQKKEADREWHIKVHEKYGNHCFFTGSGKEAKQHHDWLLWWETHHFKAKSKYPELRCLVENGLPCCWPCHYKMEKVDQSLRDYVIQKRG